MPVTRTIDYEAAVMAVAKFLSPGDPLARHVAQARRILSPLVEQDMESEHACAWVPSSTFDTGHQPPRQRWDCAAPSCHEYRWTAHPDGPDHGDELLIVLGRDEPVVLAREVH